MGSGWAPSLVLSGSTGATLHQINGGTHVDMNRAALYFASTENAMVEVHAGSDQVQQWN